VKLRCGHKEQNLRKHRSGPEFIYVCEKCYQTYRDEELKEDIVELNPENED